MDQQTIQFTMTHKVVASLIVALLGYMAWTVQDTSTKVAVLDAKVESSIDLQKRVTILESDHSAATERVNSLAFRITALEQESRK